MIEILMWVNVSGGVSGKGEGKYRLEGSTDWQPSVGLVLKS